MVAMSPPRVNRGRRPGRRGGRTCDSVGRHPAYTARPSAASTPIRAGFLMTSVPIDSDSGPILRRLARDVEPLNPSGEQKVARNRKRPRASSLDVSITPLRSGPVLPPSSGESVFGRPAPHDLISGGRRASSRARTPRPGPTPTRTTMIRPAAPVTTGHRTRTPIGPSGRSTHEEPILPRCETDRATERTQFRPDRAAPATERTQFRREGTDAVTERTQFRRGGTRMPRRNEPNLRDLRIRSLDGTNPISPRPATLATERT